MLKVLVSGAIFNIINILIQIVLGMLVFREMLLHFGEHDFGQWTFVFAILAHIMLFEFGLGSVISKITPLLKKEQQSVARFSTAIVIIFGIGLVFLVLTSIASYALTYFPNIISFDDNVTLAALLFLLGTSFVFTFQAGALQAYLTGKFKVGRLNIIKVGVTVARSVSILTVLNLGYGVFAVAIIFSLSAFLQVTIMIYVAVRTGLLNEFRFAMCSKDSLHYIMQRGSRFMFMGFNGYVRNNGALIVCGIVIGSVALVPLRIAGRLIEIYGEVSTSLIYMLTPYFSSLNNNDKAPLNKSFQISIAASSLVSTLIFINMFFLGEWFLEVWLGEVPLGTFEVLIMLAAGYCFANAQAPCTPIMISKDKNDNVMWLSIVEIVILLALIYPMITEYGVIGSAYATFISLIVSRGMLQPILISRILHISLYEYFLPVILPMLITTIMFTSIHQLSNLAKHNLGTNYTFSFLVLQALVFGFIALLALNRFKVKTQLK